MDIVQTIRETVNDGGSYIVYTGEVIVGTGNQYNVETVAVLTPSTDACPIVLPIEDYTDEIKRLVSN